MSAKRFCRYLGLAGLLLAAPSAQAATPLAIGISPHEPLLAVGTAVRFAGPAFYSNADLRTLSPATVVAGSDHSCALLADGTVRCWGANGSGQLGEGSGNQLDDTPVQVNGLTAATALALGGEHSCALLGQGLVLCWGGNGAGQLGNGTTTNAPTPVLVSGITTSTPATALAAGTSHTCALLADGTVRCWGANASGQLGNGTNSPSSIPVAVTGINSAVAIAAGAFHTCAVLADGGMRCWGNNGFGQLGDGTTDNANTPATVSGLVTATVPVGGNDYSCALLNNGRVRCWGFNGFGQLGNGDDTGPELCAGNPCSKIPIAVTGISTAAALAGGGSHACARLDNGTLRCWGLNANGQLGNGGNTKSATPVAVNGITTAVIIAAGGSHSCAGLAGGSVRCWGFNATGQLGNGTSGANTDAPTPVAVHGLSTVAAIATGSAHSCALLTGGSIHCWGYNGSGQLGGGSGVPFTGIAKPVVVGGITSAIVLAAGESHSCAILADGAVRCWGANGAGQLGDGTTNLATTPVAVSDITTATAVALGTNHSCARLANGTVRCWGLNGFGQLGNGTNDNSLTSVEVSGITTATAIAAGYAHTCARLADGSVRCWGSNFLGGLGNGTTTDSAVPVTVSGVTTAVAIAAGGDHSCALLADGSLRCWGENTNGQLGNGSTTSSSLPVAVSGITTATMLTASAGHTCAVLTSRRTWCWGLNGDGQLGVGGLTDSSVPKEVLQTSTATATAIAAGGAHTCALQADSAAHCWGSNGLSQLGGVIPGPAAVLVWTSSNPAVARIAGNGHALAVALGTTTIAASYGGISGNNTLLTVAADTDGDTVLDPADNCTTVANANQRDTDTDGYGNVCDGDLNQSNFVNITDLGIFKARFGTTNADADLDGNGFVNITDLGIFKSLFGKAPGPSGLVP